MRRTPSDKLLSSEVLDIGNMLYKKRRTLYDHSFKVATLSQAICEALDLKEIDSRRVFVAGFLHDVGKLLFWNSLFTKKKTELTEKDLLAIREHPVWGFEYLAGTKTLQDYAPYVLYHHELPGRRGYPAQLPLKEIPMESRIINIANRYSTACLEDLPYRKKRFTPQAALAMLQDDIRSFFGARKVEAVSHTLVVAGNIIRRP